MQDLFLKARQGSDWSAKAGIGVLLSLENGLRCCDKTSHHHCTILVAARHIISKLGNVSLNLP